MKNTIFNESGLEDLIKDIVSREIEYYTRSIPKNSDLEQYLTEETVCNILQKSKVTLWRMRKNGAIPYHKHGNKILYKKSDLDQFINENYTG